MNIVIVTTEFESSGGVKSVVEFLLRAIRAEVPEWNVDVMSLQMSRRGDLGRRIVRPGSWFTAQRVRTAVVDGLSVHEVGSSLAEVEWCRFLPRRWLDELLRSADRIVVVSGTPAVSVSVRRASAPVVLQVATLVREERRATVARMRPLQRTLRSLMTAGTAFLDEIGLRQADVVLVENLAMLDACMTRGIERVTTCAPGVDTDYFSPDEGALKRGYILMCGRLGDKRKNISGLLRAYSRARTLHGLSQRLVLAGRTPPGEEENRLIRSLGLQELVEIRSPVSRDELRALYRGADLFASMSFEEGLGLTYIEALACAVPVVATATEGAKYVFDGCDAGTLVDYGPDLIEAFAVELSSWCGDPERRSNAGRVARSVAVARFSDAVAGRHFVASIAGAAVDDRRKPRNRGTWIRAIARAR